MLFKPGDGDCPASPVCKDRNIPRLVYTSTINVVFTGQPIEECDESSASYVPPGVVSITTTPLFLSTTANSVLKGWFWCVFQYIDHYSRTKAIAEQMVLSADGIPLKGMGDNSAAAEPRAAWIPTPLGRVSGSRVFLTLTGAGPLFSSVNVTLHLFTYSVKPKSKSCLPAYRRLKVNNRTFLAPPTFPAWHSCSATRKCDVFLPLLNEDLGSLSWRWGPAPHLRPAAERHLRPGWEETPLPSDGEAPAPTECKERKHGSSGVCPAEWVLPEVSTLLMAQASGYIVSCSSLSATLRARGGWHETGFCSFRHRAKVWESAKRRR